MGILNFLFGRKRRKEENKEFDRRFKIPTRTYNKSLTMADKEDEYYKKNRQQYYDSSIPIMTDGFTGMSMGGGLSDQQNESSNFGSFGGGDGGGAGASGTFDTPSYNSSDSGSSYDSGSSSDSGSSCDSSSSSSD